MNVAIIIGNLCKDPDLRYSTGEDRKAVCRFTVAVNTGYGDNQRTSFLPVVCFGKQAENCDKFLRKGSKVSVRGLIQTGSYTNKEGQKVYTTEIVADNFGIEFLTKAENTGRQREEWPPEGFAGLEDDDIQF